MNSKNKGFIIYYEIPRIFEAVITRSATIIKARDKEHALITFNKGKFEGYGVLQIEEVKA